MNAVVHRCCLELFNCQLAHLAVHFMMPVIGPATICTNSMQYIGAIPLFPSLFAETGVVPLAIPQQSGSSCAKAPNCMQESRRQHSDTMVGVPQQRSHRPAKELSSSAKWQFRPFLMQL